VHSIGTIVQAVRKMLTGRYGRIS